MGKIERGLKTQLKEIPIGNFYHADRYDTDNEYVLHLWKTNTEKTFDLRTPKKWHPIKVCSLCNKPIERQHKFIRRKGGHGHKVEHRKCDDPMSY
jgi:hypothetical protein